MQVCFCCVRFSFSVLSYEASGWLGLVFAVSFGALTLLTVNAKIRMPVFPKGSVPEHERQEPVGK